MLWHCVDTSPMWLCSHPGECSHPLSFTCQLHRMSLVGWHIQMCLLTSIFPLLVLFMSQSGRFMSLNPASLSVQALSVPSLSSLSDTTLLSHSHSVYQIPWYHTSLPLDALTPSALPMVCKASHQQGPHTTSHWNSPRLPISALSSGGDSELLTGFPPIPLPPSINPELLIPHAVLVSSVPGKDCPFCPKPFVQWPLSCLYSALDTSPGAASWVTSVWRRGDPSSVW